jgi:drug/metabolite transporter (DMT)-like permease
MSRKGWALFIALCVIWGIPYLLIRIAVEELAPAALVFFRTAPAALLLLPLAMRRGSLAPLFARWRWVLAYTAVELAVPWWLLSHAEQRLTSSAAGLLVAAVPLIGVVLYRAAGVVDHVDARRFAGLVVGFTGVAALVGLDLGRSDPAAMAEVGLVALCYATGPLLVSRQLAGLPTIGVVTASLVVTAGAYTAPALLDLPATVSLDTILAVATLAVVCTALAFLIFFALIHEVGPARSTVITYINPLVAVLLGVALLAEPFTVGIAVGLPLILVGSVLGTAPPLRRAQADAQARGQAAAEAPARPAP